MKLAEALQLRADLTEKINQTENNLTDNVLVQEGEKPNLDPQELQRTLEEQIAENEKIVCQINITNSLTVTESGETLTSLIAHRDALQRHIRALSSAMGTAGTATRRATKSEIKILTAIDVKELQKKIDKLQAEYRRTDNEIQRQNWIVDLKE